MLITNYETQQADCSILLLPNAVKEFTPKSLISKRESTETKYNARKVSVRQGMATGRRSDSYKTIPDCLASTPLHNLKQNFSSQQN